MRVAEQFKSFEKSENLTELSPSAKSSSQNESFFQY